MSDIYKGELQDYEGNTIYPHSEADVIFCTDGETAQSKLNKYEEALGNVTGVTDSLEVDDSKILVSAKALHKVNSSLQDQPDFVYDSTGKITGYKTKVGADTVFPFSSGSNYIKIEVEHNPNTGLTISEQIGKSSSLINVATIPNINTSYKTGLCTYKRGTNSTTDTITFNVSGSYKITLNNVETVYSINAGESKTFTISRTKMTIEVTIV